MAVMRPIEMEYPADTKTLSMSILNSGGDNNDERSEQ